MEQGSQPGSDPSGSDRLFGFVPIDVLDRRQQFAAGAISLACLLVLATSWLLEFNRRGRSVNIERAYHAPATELKIDINASDWPELTLLP